LEQGVPSKLGPYVGGYQDNGWATFSCYNYVCPDGYVRQVGNFCRLKDVENIPFLKIALQRLVDLATILASFFSFAAGLLLNAAEGVEWLRKATSALGFGGSVGGVSKVIDFFGGTTEPCKYDETCTMERFWDWNKTPQFGPFGAPSVLGAKPSADGADAVIVPGIPVTPYYLTKPLAPGYDITFVQNPGAPVAGKGLLAIKGRSFGPAEGTVTVGSLPCKLYTGDLLNPVVGSWADELITCIFPLGAHALVTPTIVVTTAMGLISDPFGLTYLGPYVRDIHTALAMPIADFNKADVTHCFDGNFPKTDAFPSVKLTTSVALVNTGGLNAGAAAEPDIYECREKVANDQDPLSGFTNRRLCCLVTSTVAVVSKMYVVVTDADSQQSVPYVYITLTA